MAKASWCTTTPESGSGNGTVNVGASVHTGRNQRTTSLTFKATGVTDQTVAVTQLAKAEFVTLTNVSASKGGGTVTMTGKTNSSKLTFSLGTGDLVVSLPASYSAGGASTANGSAISGDPGAAAEFEFSLEFSVPENTTTGELTKTVTVAANGGQTASATITQAAGDAALSLSASTITFDAEGTAKSITVTSNTNWTVS